MRALKIFMNSHVVPKGASHANIGSLRGGLWCIPYEKKCEFFDLYVSAIREMTPRYNTSYMFRPHNASSQPFCIDVDLRTVSKFTFHSKYLLDLAEKICAVYGKCEVACVVKEKGYFKTINGTRLYATGGHLYFSKIVTREESMKMREFAMSQVAEVFKDIQFVNTAEDVIDKAIPERSNGLMFVGDYKKDGLETGGRYMIRGVLRYDEDGEPKQIYQSKLEFMQKITGQYLAML